jgi:hypothetical protein
LALIILLCLLVEIAMLSWPAISAEIRRNAMLQNESTTT